MASKALNPIAAFFIVSALAMILMGCQQQGDAASDKQARLLAAQNAELQQQLTARRAEIQAMRQRHAEELRRQEKELTEYKARIEILQTDIEKGIAERVSGVTTALVDENAALRKEVERLKAQVEELKRQVQP